MTASPAERLEHDRLRAAGRALAARPLRERLRIVQSFRRRLAADPEPYLEALAEGRGARELESLAAELLPLADACRELERGAPALLRPRRAGALGRPLWLGRLSHEVHREPHGVVAIVAPGNVPLLLAAVQTLQALVAGNAVALKPAPRGEAVLRRFVAELIAAGLPAEAIRLAEPDPAGFQASLAAADHVIVTGSAETGATVLAQRGLLAPATTLELSGHDAVFVLPGADLERVARALAFGLTWLGGEVCIAPRRVFLIGQGPGGLEALVERLRVRVGERLAACAELKALALDDDRASGPVAEARATGSGPDGGPDARPVIDRLEGIPGRERAAGSRWIPLSGSRTADALGVFALSPDSPTLTEPAPVLGLLAVEDVESALALAARCPSQLGASIFGPVPAAKALALRVSAGSVTINDLIAPTADPRAPFPARGASGSGVSRGPEGLLAMTRLKVIHTRHGGPVPHLAAETRRDAAVLRAWLAISRGSWRTAIAGLLDLSRALFMADRAAPTAAASDPDSGAGERSTPRDNTPEQAHAEAGRETP